MGDHPPALVVGDDDHDRKPLADRRVELHEIEPDRSIADDEKDAAFGMAEFRRIGEGDPDREAAIEAGIEITPARPDRPRHSHPDLGVAAVGDHDVILPAHEGVNLPGKAERMDRHGLALPERLRRGLSIDIGILEGLHPALKPAAQPLAAPLGFDEAVQLHQKRPDIADDAQIHAAVPADLLRLDVRLDEFRVLPEDVTEEVEEAEAAPEEEDQVGARERKEGRAGTDGERRPET